MIQAHFPLGSLGSALFPTQYVSLIHGCQQLHFHSRQIQRKRKNNLLEILPKE